MTTIDRQEAIYLIEDGEIGACELECASYWHKAHALREKVKAAREQYPELAAEIDAKEAAAAAARKAAKEERIRDSLIARGID